MTDFRRETPSGMIEIQLEELGKQIYDLSWKGKWWGPDGAIALERKRFKLKRRVGSERAGLSALSSTYYAAAGAAVAHFKEVYANQLNLVQWVLWSTRAAYCLMKARQYSDQVEKKFGIKNMTPDELDVRSAILRKTKRHDLAAACAREALSRSDVSDSTKVLLWIGLGESHVAMGNSMLADEMYLAAIHHVSNSPPTTQVRYHRSVAMYHKTFGRGNDATNHFLHALQLAREHGLHDQIPKIEEAARQ